MGASSIPDGNQRHIILTLNEIIVLCVRWYFRYSLSCRDSEEMIAGRNLSVDHTTIWRWVQSYAPVLIVLIKRELKPTGGSWRMDETYILVAGRWTYPYRGVDSDGSTIDFFLSPEWDAAAARQGFQSFDGAWRTIQGYEVVQMIYKGQVRWLPKGGVAGQVLFIHQTLGRKAA